MPKSCNQKMKILYLVKALMEETDKDHVLSMNELISKLTKYGIKAERKSIYDDIDALRSFGFDIVLRREKPVGYWLKSRNLDIADLKLIVDAVQSSRFITTKKTNQIVKKLETSVSNFQSPALQRSIRVPGRIKTMNESIYFNLDKIQSAIQYNAKISFQYVEWTIGKEIRYCKNGKSGEVFRVSPWNIIWDGCEYRMVGYNEYSGEINIYKINRMFGISILKDQRQGRQEYLEFDKKRCLTSDFSIYSKQEEEVSFIFENELIGDIIERFGREIQVIKRDDGHFTTKLTVCIGPQFYSWITSMGTKARISSPESVVTGYKNYLEEIQAQYK